MQSNPHPPDAQKNSGQRLIQLDVLRGIAILMVIATHYPVIKEAQNAGHLQKLSNAFIRFGWSGVDLFFVLSGFLVGGLLFSEIRTRGTLDVKRFLVRRAFKIWPLYYVFIVFWMLRKKMSGYSFPEILDMYWPNLLHIQNYFPDKPYLHTWTLAVEEHFYLALPLVIAFAVSRLHRRNSQRSPAPLTAIPALPVLAFAVLMGCTLGRIFATFQMPIGQNREADIAFYNWIYSVSHLRFDSLFFGVLLAYWHHFEPRRFDFAKRHTGALLLLGLALISPMLFLARLKSPFVTVVGFNLLYLGYGAILMALVYSQPLRTGGVVGRFLMGRIARALAFIGVFSYPIYLWHLDTGIFVVRGLMRRGVGASMPVELRWLIGFALTVAISIVAGIFWSKVLEKPSLALRDRLFPRLSPGPLEHTEAARSAEKSPPLSA